MKVTEEEEKHREQTKKQEEDFEKSQPNFCYRLLNCCSYTPAVFKAILNVFLGRGIDIEPNKTLSVISFFYWEIVVYMGKFLLIIVVVFFTDINMEIQTNLTLVVIAILLFIQLKNMPYERKVLNTMHVTLLTTMMIVCYTRSMIRDFNISYDVWRQQQIIRGLNPITQEVATIARLYEFETNSMSFFYNALVVLIIVFTFYIDLYFMFHLYIQALLYFYDNGQGRKSRLYKILTLKNQWLNGKVTELWQQEQTFISEEAKTPKVT